MTHVENGEQREPVDLETERREPVGLETDDDPGGSVEHEAAGRDHDHAEENNPDDFDEAPDEGGER